MSTENVILDAAEALLETTGSANLTTRAVCEAAGVKSPTLYHYFGDKDGLERALIKRGMAKFMQQKRTPQKTTDPLKLLRVGWDIALEFALEHPALYSLLAHHARTEPDLIAESFALMHGRVQRLVDMGIFRCSVDEGARAIWAASQGALSLVRKGYVRKEVKATSELLFNAVINELSCVARSSSA